MKRDRAFTILEILVVITLTGIIMMFITGSWWMVIRRQASDSRPSKQRMAEDSARLMRILRGMIEIPVIGEPSFRMTNEPEPILEAVCSLGGMSLPMGATDIARIRLVFEPGTGGSLSMENGFLTPSTNEFDIFDGAATMQIACLDRNGQWLSEWKPEADRHGIPRAIRWTVGYHDGNRPVTVTRMVSLPVGNAAI